MRSLKDLLNVSFRRGSRQAADAKARAEGSPRPKFVTTHYDARRNPVPREGRVSTEAGREINRRGMLKYHYRSDAAARKEGVPRTLSQFSEVNPDGAVSGPATR